MRLKNMIIIVFMLSSFICISQISKFSSNIPNTLILLDFKTQSTNLFSITSLEMLSKIETSETIFDKTDVELSPQNYNWRRDSSRIQSYKRMILDYGKQDVNGRDLAIDINQELVNKVYFRDNKLEY